jgi:MYXO-CTERM domain-containing protein
MPRSARRLEPGRPAPVLRFRMLLALLAFAAPARAADTWTNIAPGVDYLERVTSDPLHIYAARVDISLPNVAVRATKASEAGQTTAGFQADVGSLVTINADWSDGYTPVGLSIGDGWMWHDPVENWSYFSCDIFKNCEFDETPEVEWYWTQGRRFNGVGANYVRLVDNGAAIHIEGDPFYDSDRHPRSAICLEPDGAHLWMVVVQGRVSWSRGTTYNETADLMQSLGCWDSVMLDGGGSSTLMLGPYTMNTPTDGSQRVVGSHLGILYRESRDPSCAVDNGRWCEGTTLHTCTGGASIESGDCASWGLGCAEDGDWAFCVDPRCPDPDGNGGVCTGATTLQSCTDGTYTDGDCAYFGMVCGDEGGTSAMCIDARCPDGPEGAVCTSATTLSACTAGAYAEADCASSGQVCDAGACVTPDSGGGVDSATESGDSGARDSAAADSASPDANADGAPEPNGGCGCGTGPAHTPEPSAIAAWIALVVGVAHARRARGP